MIDIAARPNSFPWPPVICLAGIVAAIVLGILFPTPWIGPPLSDILFAFGCLLVVGTVAIDLAAMRALARGKTTAMPHKGSEHLVTNGPYSFTRNPIYLGYAMLLIGAGLILGNLWFVAFAVVIGFAIQKLAIEREEQHLKARFGKRFIDYAKRVRRWI